MSGLEVPIYFFIHAPKRESELLQNSGKYSNRTNIHNGREREKKQSRFLLLSKEKWIFTFLMATKNQRKLFPSFHWKKILRENKKSFFRKVTSEYFGDWGNRLIRDWCFKGNIQQKNRFPSSSSNNAVFDRFFCYSVVESDWLIALITIIFRGSTIIRTREKGKKKSCTLYYSTHLHRNNEMFIGTNRVLQQHFPFVNCQKKNYERVSSS